MAIEKTMAKNPQKFIPVTLMFTYTVLCAKHCKCFTDVKDSAL